MGLLGYGLMSFLAIVYEVFKVLFYVLGVLCFLKYLKSDRQPRPKMPVSYTHLTLPTT